MKYGVVNFKNPDPSQIIILGRPGFPITTYINGYYNVDAVFLYTDSIFTYGMISGVKFEVMTNDIQLIPHIQLTIHTPTMRINQVNYTTMSRMILKVVDTIY